MTKTHLRVSTLKLIRRFRKLSQATALSALLAMQGQQVMAATLTKVDNTDNLTLGSSWVGGIAPTAADILRWDSTVIGANTTALGANLSVLGLQVLDPGGSVSISAGNTLTVGTSGIDMSAATQNLTISSGLTLGNGGQIWNVATGRTLTLNTGTFTRSLGTGLSVQGAGTVSASMTGLANTNSILGPWASIGTGTSTRYATLSAGNIASLTGTAVAAFGWPSGNNNTFNYDVAAVQAALGVGRQANTARYTGAAGTQNWGNNNTTAITLNGLMNAGTGTLTFSEAGGTSQGELRIGTNNGHELVLNAANAGIQINIPITNTGANVGSLLVMGQGANSVNITSSGGVSTYTGATTVASGTLLVSGAGSINTTSGIAVNGIGAKYLHTSSVASTRTITLTNGTVDGTTTLGTVNVADNAANILANGDGGTTALTLGTLAFSGDATINARRTIGVPFAVTGALSTTPANGTVVINVPASTSWSNGLNNLITYGSFAGSASDFTLGTVTGLNSRQSAGGIQLNGNAIAFNVIGDSPKWTGIDSAQWVVGTTGASSNWKLITAATATDYIAGDQVLFDDSATGSTTVQIDTANVSPTSTIFDNSSLNYTVASSGSFGIAGTGSLTKNGTGELTLSAANTHTGGTVLNAGTLNLNGAGALSTGALAINGGSVNFNAAGAAGTGVVIVNTTATATIGGVSASVGNINIPSGNLTVAGTGTLASTTNAVTYVGYTTGTGVLNLDGPNYTTAGEVRVGGSDVNGTAPNGTGTLNVTAGSVTLNALTVGRGNNNQNTVSGTVNVSGGTLASTNDVILGFAGNNNLGKLTITGNGTVNVGPAATKWLIVSVYDTSNGQVEVGGNGALNLMNNSSIKFTTGNTGTASTNNSITQSGGTVSFYSDAGTTLGGTGELDLQQSGAAAVKNTYHLNGGTLTVGKVSSTLATGTRTFNFNGGTLKAPASTATWFNIGAGNARANVRNGGAILDTNGFDVTFAQALLHSNEVGDNAIDGGLTKNNAGALTLTGTSTYTGATAVTGGSLVLSGTGAINASSGIALSGGAKLLQSSSVASTPAIAVSSGSVDGSGTIGAVTFDDLATNSLANGNLSGTGALTLSSLSFNGDAVVNPRANTAAAPIIITGALTTTPGSGTVTVNPFKTAWATGLNDLISFGSFGGSVTDFTLGSVTGSLTTRQSVGSLQLTGSSLALNIIGDFPKWTGLDSSQWVVGTTGAGSNWKLATAATATDFIAGDEVIFDDTATGGTAVQIDTADVSPASTTFNNSSLGYSINSAGGFGIAGGSITKNGSGTATLNTVNTTTGAITVNAGTLEIGGAGSIVTSNAMVTHGTLAFNSSVAHTLSAAITGTGGVSTNGSGGVTITGTKAYTGDTTVGAAGLLSLGNGAAQGAVAGNIVANGALTVNTNTAQTVANTISGNGSLTKSGTGVLTLTGNNTFSGAATISAGGLVLGDGTVNGVLPAASIANTAGLTFNVAAASSTSNASAISGAGALTKSGTGTLTLSGNSNYTGTTNLTAGTLIAGSPTALGNSANLSFSAGTTYQISTDGGDNVIGMNSGTGTTINVVSDRATPGAGISHSLTTPATLGIGGTTINFTSGANVTSGIGSIHYVQMGLSTGFTGVSTVLNPTTANVTIGNVFKVLNNASTTLELGGTSTGNEISGVISNGAALLGANNISIVKSGTSTWTLSGNNTYTGTTTVNGGTLRITADNALGAISGGTTVNNGALLVFDNITYTAAEPIVVNGTGQVLNIGNSSFAGSITATSNYTINANGGNVVIGGGLVKDGTTLTISGGGKVTVNTVGISGASANSDLIVDGTTLVVNAASNYNGPTTLQNSGTLVANASVTTTQVTINSDSELSGTGSINQGAGVIYMNGALVVGDSTLVTPVVSQFEISGTGATILGALSMLEFDLFGRGGDLTGDATKADRLKLFGALDTTTNPGGTLKINANGVTGFAAGDMWTLFDLTSGGTVGTGLTLDVGSLGLGGGLSASFNNLTGVLSISGLVVPEPSRMILLMAGMLSLVVRRRRR